LRFVVLYLSFKIKVASLPRMEIDQLCVWEVNLKRASGWWRKIRDTVRC